MIAMTHGGYEEIGKAVVIDVGKRSAYRDLVRQSYACSLGDVLKFSTACIAPKLVSPKLGGEINVQQTIAIHVGDGNSIAMIVMDRLVVLAGVLDDLMLEANVAGR